MSDYRKRRSEKKEKREPIVFEKTFRCPKCNILISDLEISHTILGGQCLKCGSEVTKIK